MRQVLIISDSRGRALNRQLCTINWHYLGFIVYILFFPGATIQSGITRALNLMGNMSFDIIYIYLGVNNLSTLISPRNIIPIYTNKYIMATYILRELIHARSRLIGHSDKIIICELIGLNYELYNRVSGRTFLQEQQVLTNGIIIINEKIRQYNNHAGLFSPHVAHFTHKQRKELNNLAHRYRATTRDGIHLKCNVDYAILDRFIIATIQQI